jgi:AcrR family transcriptional regulator
MSERRRLSGEERRGSILRAAARVFAENGFRGTTTKALAEAAGVSEALIFKHFPSKEALFEAMQAGYAPDQEAEGYRRLMAMPPSTATLVFVVHAYYDRMVEDRPPGAESEDAVLARLMFRSLMDDGEFARVFLRRVASRLVAKVAECIPAAASAGDMDASPSHPDLLGWFAHHLGVTLLLYRLPETSAVDYGVSRQALVAQAVGFVLRGIGLKEEAIRRCYRPEESSPRRD